MLFSLLVYINVTIHYLTGVALISPNMTTMLLQDFTKVWSHRVSSARLRAEKKLGWKPTPWKELVKKTVKEFNETRKAK